MAKSIYTSMLKKYYNTFFILILTIFVVEVSLSAHAAEVFYFYDDMGRINKVIAETGDVAIYSYDEVGNLLSISRETTSPLPPEITGISPDIVFAGTTTPITITGNNLMGTTDVSVDAAGVSISGVTVTDTAITATLNISRDAATGSVNIKVSTVFGTASQSITLMQLTITPTIKTILPGNAADFRLDISQNAPKNINISLISEDTSVIQVPTSMTFGMGQNTLTFTANALTEGTTVIRAANGAASASVYVTQPFTGEATSASLPVSVYIEQSTSVDGATASAPVSVYIEESKSIDGGTVATVPVSVYIEQAALVDATTASLPVSVLIEQSTAVEGIIASMPVSVYIEQPTTVDAIIVSPPVSAEISSQ